MIALHAYEWQAIAAGAAVALTCATLSIFVVLRRMAFIGQGVSHAGFGGVATAALLAHWAPALNQPVWRDAVTLAFCMVAALAMGYYGRRKRVGSDAAIGILLVATMALGAVLVSVRVHVLSDYSYRVDWDRLMFGDILAVTRADVVIAAALAGAVLTTVLLLGKELVSFAYDEAMARIEGLPTRALHALLLVLLSVTIVLALKAVGFLLVSALLIIPGATANLISRRFVRVVVWSLAVGLGGTLGGLGLSLRVLDRLPTGATIALTLFAIFAATFAATGLARRGR